MHNQQLLSEWINKRMKSVPVFMAWIHLDISASEGPQSHLTSLWTGDPTHWPNGPLYSSRLCTCCCASSSHVRPQRAAADGHSTLQMRSLSRTICCMLHCGCGRPRAAAPETSNVLLSCSSFLCVWNCRESEDSTNWVVSAEHTTWGVSFPEA